MATARKTIRPTVYDSETGVADADHLRTVVDLYDDHSVLVPLVLYFADYTGLESEWDAGVATTVLEEAVEDALGLTAGDAGSGTRDDPSEYEMEAPE
jgi:hypothetical protein